MKKISLLMCVLHVLGLACTSTWAEELPGPVQSRVLSKFEILDIDYIERLEEGPKPLYYIRSILHTHELDPEFSERFPEPAITYLNGIYRLREGRFHPEWELPGTYENGFGLLHSKTSAGGAVNELGDIETSFLMLRDGNRHYLIHLIFTRFRDYASTLILVDLAHPEKPVWSGSTKVVNEFKQRDQETIGMKVFDRLDGIFLLELKWSEEEHCYKMNVP